MEHVAAGTNPIWEVSMLVFVFVTVILGGGAAYLTGRAVAQSWLANHQLVIYLVLLTAATRFIHFALFDGTLISLWYFCVDLIVLLAMGFAGKSVTRNKQMSTQYGFLSGQG
ncbi:MAG: hypothetical protein GY933_00720, partial [Hyphomicrobiales bacterium]|nr:hypothetical protein [Hyphomicrobiales bacterium]